MFESDPQRAAALISGWFGERRREFEGMQRRARALGRPGALNDIVRDLSTLARHPDTVAA